MLTLMVVFWQSWSTELKVVAAIAALVPIHVVEEWVFPGGFHYQMNTCMGSKEVDWWPMSRLTDMMTNLIATFMYVGLTIYCWCVGCVSDGIVLGTILFCLLEFIVHTALGTSMYFRFRSAGKKTIYGPGSITTYCVFCVLGGILCYSLDWSALTGHDWFIGLIISLGGIVVLAIAAPTLIFKRVAPRYPYPRTFYFEQYINK